MNNPVHIMLDLETTALTPDAGIIGIGAYRMFAPSIQRSEFKQLISVEDNEKIGRSIGKETMIWWDKQDRELRDEMFSSTMRLSAALDSYQIWVEDQCSDLNNVFIWANGSEFDNVIIKHAFEQCHNSYPFNFRNHRCFRTLRAIGPPNSAEGISKGRPHDPLSDAIYQGKIAERILGSAPR